MGFLDKLFEKGRSNPTPSSAPPKPKCEALTVYAPLDGQAVPLEKFPDEIFSQGVLGPGCGILPAGNKVFAPFNGTVTQAVDTRHAIGVTSEDGVEVLIHVGVDTVEMAGQGFQSPVKMGQKINRGDLLLSFDRAAIKSAGHSDAVAVVVTNADEFSGLTQVGNGEVRSGDILMRAEK